MKIYKYLGLSFLTLALAGCQNEETVGGQQQEDVFTLKAHMDGYSNDSRAQIQLGNQWQAKETFYWNEGDKFTLIEKIVNDDEPEVTITPKLHEFTISDTYSNDSPYSSADFTSPTALTYLSNFVAYYPAVREDDSGYNCYINNKLVDNSEASWTGYFKNNMFMKATGISVPSDQMGLNFQQMCSLIRITYTNATGNDRIIKKIEVNGDWGTGFHISKDNLEPSLPCSGQGGNYGIEFTNVATIKAGESEDFYILYYPLNEYQGNTNGNAAIMDQISVLLDDNTYLRTDAYPYTSQPDLHTGTGKRYWFNVTDFGTPEKLEWTKHAYVVIENETLSSALSQELGDEMNITIDPTTGYATMLKRDVENVTELVFNNHDEFTPNYTITSLDGIEHFTNLTKLVCEYTGLTGEVNLTNNTKLQILNLSFNLDLESLKIDGLTQLTELIYSETGITKLDIPADAIPKITLLYFGKQPNEPEVYAPVVDDFTNLTALSCYGQQFTLTNETIKSQLTDLACYSCGLTSLDLSEYPELITLACYSNQLEELEIPASSKIGSLNCHTNKLASLDITPLENSLYHLICGNQQLANGSKMELTLTSAQKERFEDPVNGWYVNGFELNEYVELNVVGNSETVVVGNADLSELLVKMFGDRVTVNSSGHTIMKKEDADAVTVLDFSDTQTPVTTLNELGCFKNLKTVICQWQSELDEVDLSQNTELETLDIQGSEALHVLDLSENTELKSLSVTYSQLTSLDLTKNTKLEHLTCYGNKKLTEIKASTCTALSHLDLSDCTSLRTLNINNPAIVTYLHYNNTSLSLDLSGFTGLISLDCSGKPNDFAKLSTAAKAKLERLHCKNCNLTSLDLTGYTALKHLNCANNQLASLDLKNLSLESLVVDNNQLTNIDLTNSKTTLQEFYCNNNKLESLNLKDFAALRHLNANNNVLVSMDVTGCSQLFTVQCGWNNLTELDLRASKSIDYLICGSQDNQEQLVLKLDASLHNRWYDEWLAMAIKGENGNVTLWTGVDAGSGNTGANDFPIGGNY